ncbi:MAG: segregation/condensation protein A [Nitrospirales bacterium]|nr:segregation/condensation protein A [Nitrospirales bacterium]
MSQNSYSIKVPIFEGPMDLLLHLIKDNKIDIYDIPIAQITGQYLEYIDIMKELNLEIASEFLVMAATLIYIKSRMLLPPDETIEQEETEDPRLGLVQKLLEYQAYKEASGTMREREDVWTNAFPGPSINSDERADEQGLSLSNLNLSDLMEAIKKILGKLPPESVIISRETLTVKDKISLILERLEKESTVGFLSLFGAERTRVEVIVTFLALLEILRLGLAGVFQEEEFAAIWIVKPQPQAPAE